MKRFLSILLSALIVFSLFSNFSFAEGTNTSNPKDTYTYNIAWATQPKNWNPHTRESGLDSDFSDFLSTPLVSTTFNKDGGWEWLYDAAESVTDITATYQDKKAFNIPQDAKENFVYQIKLRKNLKWENGDKITADDYIESMKLLLDPDMKNYQTGNYISGNAQLKNAALYQQNNKAGQPVYTDVVGGEKEVPANAAMFLTLTQPVYFLGEEATSYQNHEIYGKFFIVNGVNLFEKYKQDYVPFTKEMIPELNALSANFGDSNPEAYKEWLVYDTGETYSYTPWEHVGLVKVDDYTFNYILEKPLNSFYMNLTLQSNWLVHIPTYKANIKTINGKKQNNYCTSAQSTMSFGPYKIKSLGDKQITLNRNPKWYGYKDGQFNGQYQADHVVIHIVNDFSEKEKLFNTGKIDKLGLESEENFDKYRQSKRIALEDESYMLRLIFATSLESLQAKDQEKGYGCRSIVHYKDFRKALSLSIDRAKFCEEATSGFQPGFFLFNKLFYHNIEEEPNLVYRDSKYAKAALLDLYGISYTDQTIDSKYDTLTGMNLAQAKQLFQSAYNQAVADGIYKKGQEIPIEIMVKPTMLIPEDYKQQELLNEFFNAGAAGTPLEGKIKVIYETGDRSRYENVISGKNMAIRGAWGGAAFYPFSAIRVYTDLAYMGGGIHESNGWNPSIDTLKMSIVKKDGSTLEDTRTFKEWSNSINENGEFANIPNERLQIFSQLEAGVLNTYQCIPLGHYTNPEILSYKIDYPVKYNVMYEFGGLRYLKFNYSDSKWNEFLKTKNNKIAY